jgi:hypothetical protein
MSKKMSKIIKGILETTDEVLGRSITRGEALRVLEFMESLQDNSTHNEPTVGHIETTVIDFVAQQPESHSIAVDEAAVTTKVKPVARRVHSYINWKKHTEWFDAIMVDTEQKVFMYEQMDNMFPGWRKLRLSSVRNRFTEEAQLRGYTTCKTSFNKKLGLFSVTPVK